MRKRSKTYAVWEFSIFISMELRGILIRPFVNSSQSVELPMPGWPRHRENWEFGSYFFQTGKTQGILF